jgi:hypothetical protein
LVQAEQPLSVVAVQSVVWPVPVAQAPAQAPHAVWPAMVWKVPAPHPAQAVSPLPEENVPTAQSPQTSEVAPVESEAFPLRHSVQLTDPWPVW